MQACSTVILRVAAILGAAGQALAQCELDRASGSPAAAWENNGSALALSESGDGVLMLLTGAINKDGAGHVFSFRMSGGSWVQFGGIPGRGAGSDDDFGAAVSFDDPLAAVGAPRYNPGPGVRGQVTIHRRSSSSWALEDTLNPDGAGEDFGRAVSLRSGALFVGAPGRDEGSVIDLGAVYIYESVGGDWVAKGKLILPEAQRFFHTWFGRSLARHNGAILVGAPGAHAGGKEDVGIVQSYVRDAGGVWQPKFQFAAPDGQVGAEFGAAVAVHGDVAVIGAPRFDAPGGLSNAGKVYIFRRAGDTSWTLEDSFEAPAPGLADYFGSAVAVRNNSAVIAEGGDQLVHIYQRESSGNWILKNTIEDPADGTNLFADKVAMWDGVVIVGDPNYDESGRMDMGCAYTFDLAACGGIGCTADYNGDGRLNINDFIAFQAGWKKKDAKADWNADGKWNINDFIAYQKEFIDGCE